MGGGGGCGWLGWVGVVVRGKTCDWGGSLRLFALINDAATGGKMLSQALN